MLAGMSALGALGALAPLPARASGQDLFGLGSRAAALGGSTTAVDGFEAVYHNPARLADERARQLTLGMIGSRPRLNLDGEDTRAPAEQAVLIGLVLPLPLLAEWRDRLGLALGVRLPTDVVVAAEVPALGVPHFGLLAHRARTVGVHLGAGVRIGEDLAVGGGVLALAELEGRIEVRPSDEGGLTSTVDNELVADYAPIVGVSLGPWSDLSGALVWRGVSLTGFDVPIDADLGDSACLGTLCLGVPVMHMAGVAQYDPAQLRTDLAWDRGDWRVSAGVAWRRWSQRPISMSPPVTGAPEHGELGLRDTWSPSASAQWSQGAFRWRASLGFAPSPAPAVTGPAALLDGDRAVGAVGVGWTWGAVTVDASLAVQALLARRMTEPGGEVRVDGIIPVAGVQIGAAL